MNMNRDRRAAQARREPDDWLDAVLSADRNEASTIDEGGFTARVLERLPRAASPRRVRWIVPAMSVLGIVVGLGAMSGAENLSFGLLELLRPELWSLRSLLSVALPLALLYGLAVDAAIRER